jgi:hypothetical protein
MPDTTDEQKPEPGSRQLQAFVGQRVLAIDLTAMPDLDDLDDVGFVVHRIDDSERPLADSITLLVAGQLLASGGPRVLGESLNATDDSSALGARLDLLELLGGGSLDAEVIACHVAEGP